MNIGIIGSGNIGCALAADLSDKGHKIYLYSNHPEKFNNNFLFEDVDNNIRFSTRFHSVSNNYQDITSNCDLIFIALPTFLIKETVKKISPYSENKKIGFVPGAGGVEFLSKPLIDKNNTVFGFERVPYVSRLKEYGSYVSASKKNAFRIASIPKADADELTTLMTELLNRPCNAMQGFISMSLTPTLHISRLYDLYSDYVPGSILNSNPDFYGEWRHSASAICFDLDSELHIVAKALNDAGINTKELVPYSIHYESETIEQLTAKLRSIKSLQNIKGPVIKNDNGEYVPDLASRYFTESFPFRLALVKGLSEILRIDVPITDKILKWYCALENKEYYLNDSFCGKDLQETSAPQAFGISTIKELKRIYE